MVRFSAPRAASSAAVALPSWEEHHLVGPRLRIGGGHLHRIPRVPEIHEIHALDHPAVLHVQAGDDALSKHQPPPLSVQRMKFISIRSPTGPDFSGWNCMPATFPRCTAA